MSSDLSQKDSNTNERDDKKADSTERGRTIGKGMTSPDSTQVPLRSEDGEPDLEAIKGDVPKGR